MLFLYTAELGGFSARVEQRVRQGLIRPFRMRTRDDEQNSLSFETLHLSSKGYVPARFLDPLSGEVECGVPMVAPTQTIFTQHCGHPNCGGLVQATQRRSKLNTAVCPHCKKPVTLQTSTVTAQIKQTPGFEHIGSMGYDGLTSFSDWLLQDMSHRKNLEGEKAALGGDIESGGLTFRGNNRSQVGMAQTRVHELVANSLGIPNLVVMPFWTAISHESSDETGRLTIIGPKLAGDAKTYIAPSWFGNCTEAMLVEDDHGKYIRRLYVSQFYDGNNRRHLCGHRGDPRFMPGYYEDEPYTDAEPPKQMCTGFSLKLFMNDLENSVLKALAEDDMPDVPGVGAIPTTYGDGEAADAAAPAPVATGKPRVAARPRAGKGTQAQAPASQPAQPQPPPVQEVQEETAVTESEGAADAEATAVAEPPIEDVPATVPAAGADAPAPAEVAPPAAPAPAAAAAAAVQQAKPGGWARPAGARPAQPPGPPRAPQAGPKPPARSAPRPVGVVKPS